MRLVLLATLAAVGWGRIATSQGAECVILGSNIPAERRSAQVRVETEDGFVRAVHLRSRQGASTVTDLMPVQNGISIRTVLMREPHDPFVWRSVFNLAAVEKDGTFLFRTWIRTTEKALETPEYLWYQVRCSR